MNNAAPEIQALPNDRLGSRPELPSTFGSYVLNVYMPERCKKWRQSTADTTGERFNAHLLPEFRGCELRSLTRTWLQRLIDEKAKTLAKSAVRHLRWDLNAVLKMALADGLVDHNPAASLVIPRTAKTLPKAVMTKDEIRRALSVLDPRERTVFGLAVLAGLRPGEISALRWGQVGPGHILIAERVYRGVADTPKTDRGRRQAAVPPGLAADLERWRAMSANGDPQALVFPSERGTFLSRANFLRRNLQEKLDQVGLCWVNFLVLRRTQASLGHDEGIDPKVAADERGHGIWVALDVYTQTALEIRRAAVAQLEAALVGEEPEEAMAATSRASRP